MLNSGKKFRALPDKKKKYSNSSVAVHIFNIPYEAMIYIYIYWSRNPTTCHQTVEKANQIIY